MKTPLFLRVLPIYMVIALMCAIPIFQNKAAINHAEAQGSTAQKKLDSRQATIKQTTPLYGTPTRIIIPNRGIDVAIVGGHFNSGSRTWTVSASAANYATNSFPVNTVANKTFIYGHWTKQIFGPTKDLQPGDVAYIYTKEGHVFKYRYTRAEVVTPDNEHVLQNLHGSTGLVLMTCTGQWAQNRRVMYFDLVEAS